MKKGNMELYILVANKWRDQKGTNYYGFFFITWANE
jgi:hypothetical protein